MRSPVKLTWRLNLLILGLVLLVGLPYYWLLIENDPSGARARPVSITELRSLAASVPGNRPERIEYELVAWRRVPGALFVAGGGLKRNLIGVMAFRLPVEGGAPIVIDSGITAGAAAGMGMERFDTASRARIDAALRGAGQVLITHEHSDHLGGVVELAGSDLSKVWFNPAQLPGNRWTDELHWPAGAVPAPRIVGSAPRAVAPGMVVIPAPSHTAGSQMIFVTLADGREFLFAGDIATMARSWQQLRARSRLVGIYLAPENRGEVFAWLRTIRALKAAAPELTVIAGHDYEWIQFDKAHRGLVEGFHEPPIRYAPNALAKPAPLG